MGCALAGVYLVTDRGITCPSLQWGFQCPFCGGTRMAASILRGDAGAAFVWNPFLFVVSVLLGLASLAWLVELLGGPRLRLPARLGRVTQGRVYWCVGVVAVLFTVARNLIW